MTETRNHKAAPRTSRPMELVYTDLSARISPESVKGQNYAMIFTDDYSGAMFLYFLRRKSDAVLALNEFLKESSHLGKLGRLRCDDGGEFTAGEFRDVLRREKICPEYTAPYSPHQNGKAERSWRTLWEMARCMLREADLPDMMWNYAMKYAAYIRNRCYSEPRKCTPFQAITGVKPNFRKLRVFGASCYAYRRNRSKLEDKGELTRFLGYSHESSPSHIAYNSATKDIRAERCVEFVNQETV